MRPSFDLIPWQVENYLEEKNGSFLMDGIEVDGEATVRKLLAQEAGLTNYGDLLIENLIRLPSYRELPKATKPGDLIALLDSGAYSQDQIYAINGRPRPASVMIDTNNQIKLIRRRDSEADLLLNEIF